MSIFHDEESHIAYCEAVRSYSDCCFLEGKEENLIKAKSKILNVFHKGYLETYYDKQMFLKLLIAILCKLNSKEEAKRYINEIEKDFQNDIINIIDNTNNINYIEIYR